MDQPSSAYATHGKALKRHQNKGPKPGCKRRLQIYYKTAKSLKNLLTSDIIKSEEEGKVQTMKRYNVYVYNNIEKIHDCYMVIAEDPVDARNVAVQRLINETGHGLDRYEITEVRKQNAVNE